MLKPNWNVVIGLSIALAIGGSGRWGVAAEEPPQSGGEKSSVLPCDCVEPQSEEPAAQVSAAPTDGDASKVLRIAADPNNLPFTNERQEGFENRIAEIVARELDRELQYEWRAQRRGFFRQTLKEGDTDLILGVPAHFEMALTTKPYYRSTYVFVSRKDRGLKVRSFDDPTLRELRIGVQMIGDDGTNTPPAHALAARGIIRNVVGFTLYGDYSQENPPARIVDAVAKGDIDIAVVWGPLAGYHAKRQQVELELVPVPPRDERTGLPFTFAISMGVRKGNSELRDRLNGIIEQRREEIESILDRYGVPRLPLEADSRSAKDKPDRSEEK